MFFHFEIKDFIDVLMVATLLYYVYRLMRASGSLRVFHGLIVFVLIWVILTQIFQMRLIGSIVDKLMSVGLLAVIIIFQTEIRHFFLTLGSKTRLSLLARLFNVGGKHQSQDSVWIMQVVKACASMSKGKVGALIVLEKDSSLEGVAETGDLIDAIINQRLIENIFFKNSPLHDGAMILSRRRIRAAGCILPVSHNQDIPKHLGLRHRAALGISQETDALAIIVSEETGGISVALDGVFELDITPEHLESVLTQIS